MIAQPAVIIARNCGGWWRDPENQGFFAAPGFGKFACGRVVLRVMVVPPVNKGECSGMGSCCSLLIAFFPEKRPASYPEPLSVIHIASLSGDDHTSERAGNGRRKKRRFHRTTGPGQTSAKTRTRNDPDGRITGETGVHRCRKSTGRKKREGTGGGLCRTGRGSCSSSAFSPSTKTRNAMVIEEKNPKYTHARARNNGFSLPSRHNCIPSSRTMYNQKITSLHMNLSNSGVIRARSLK